MVPPELDKEEIPLKLREQDDPKFAAGRIAFFQYLTVAVFVFLVSGFWELQIGNPDYYSERAERNRIKALPILAPRGKILDREGRVIVDNHASHSLILSRENLRPEHLRAVAEGLHLDYEDLQARLRRFERTRPKYEPIIIKEELAPGELAFVEAHRHNEAFPEMELIHAHRRLYPKNGLAAHVVGYIGEVSEAELNTLEFARYRQGDVIGKAGIERYYNRTLMGVDGQRRVVVDSLGRERELIGIQEATPGQDLQLTLDLDLQVVAELAMEGRRGAVVALDPRNGEVLAMVSRPAFDPNKFAGRIRSGDWQALVEDPERPLLNRAIQAQLAPASTFKPVVALAGLETGAVDPDFTVHCPGGATFYGRYFKCHLRGGHGAVSLYKGLVQSCDVYFYNVGNRLGIDKIAEYAELVGFGRKTGIDLPHEAAGLVPSSSWKIRNFRQKWYAGETISVAIGQGALTVTPLQLAYATGGLVMGGVWHTPHLVKQARPAGSPRVAQLNADYAAEIVNALFGVVNDGGTGARARIPGVEVCGKTGTAQLASNAALKSAKLAEAFKDNAWFVGFAPRHNPEIVVVALYEAGEHGHLAAPIVRDVIKAYFDKQRPRRTPEVLAAKGPAEEALPAGSRN
jgi:penicillin-binding protein 2